MSHKVPFFWKIACRSQLVEFTINFGPATAPSASVPCTLRWLPGRGWEESGSVPHPPIPAGPEPQFR